MKILFLSIIFTLVINVSVYAKEVITLDCEAKEIDMLFELNLDYKKSLIKVSKQNQPHHMIFDDQVIKTSTPGSTNITHYLWELSRLTGRGFISAYKISEEELEKVKQSYIAEILLSKVGDLENESLNPKRNEIIIKYLVPFLESQKPEHTTKFECKKTEVKF